MGEERPGVNPKAGLAVLSYEQGKKIISSQLSLGGKMALNETFTLMIYSLSGHVATGGEGAERAVKMCSMNIQNKQKTKFNPPPYFVLTAALVPSPGVLDRECLPTVTPPGQGMAVDAGISKAVHLTNVYCIFFTFHNHLHQ